MERLAFDPDPTERTRRYAIPSTRWLDLGHGRLWGWAQRELRCVRKCRPTVQPDLTTTWYGGFDGPEIAERTIRPPAQHQPEDGWCENRRAHYLGRGNAGEERAKLTAWHRSCGRPNPGERSTSLDFGPGLSRHVPYRGRFPPGFTRRRSHRGWWRLASRSRRRGRPIRDVRAIANRVLCQSLVYCRLRQRPIRRPDRPGAHPFGPSPPTTPTGAYRDFPSDHCRLRDCLNSNRRHPRPKDGNRTQGLDRPEPLRPRRPTSWTSHRTIPAGSPAADRAPCRACRH